MSATIARPRPAPVVVVRARAWSRRVNRRKHRLALPGGDAGPVVVDSQNCLTVPSLQRDRDVAGRVGGRVVEQVAYDLLEQDRVADDLDRSDVTGVHVYIARVRLACQCPDDDVVEVDGLHGCPQPTRVHPSEEQQLLSELLHADGVGQHVAGDLAPVDLPW